MHKSTNHTYDIAVIGAGPAGSMAALRSAQDCPKGRQKARKKTVLKDCEKTVLIEKNNSIGKKMVLTGKGRCNISNTASIDTFIEKFGKHGLFLRSAFNKFSNQDLIDFFESNGLKLKIERQGRIFPVTDSAESVLEILKRCISRAPIEVIYNTRLNNVHPHTKNFGVGVKKEENIFVLDLGKKGRLKAKKLILATGGVSFKQTGSTGDGFSIAKKLGHTITPLKPGLVPLKTKELWIKNLQGVTLKNIKLTFSYGNKKIVSPIGELMFTHFGISGPLVLDLSSTIVSLLEQHRQISLSIDLKPALNPVQLEKRLLKDFINNGKMKLKNGMNYLLPKRLVSAFIHIAGLDQDKKLSQVTHKERETIIYLLKSLPLTIIGALHIESAMVTCGGISTKEINQKTMESKIVPGLFFAGELIDGAAPSGGYNLQQAFSTGFLAGESACIEK